MYDALHHARDQVAYALRVVDESREHYERVVRQAQAKGCGFVHYAFDVPGIDFKAIETIGAA